MKHRIRMGWTCCENCRSYHRTIRAAMWHYRWLHLCLVTHNFMVKWFGWLLHV